MAKRRVLVNNGGVGNDAKLAPAEKSTDEKPTTTGTKVFLRLVGNGQAAANYAANEKHVSFNALLVNAGILFDRGEVTANGKSGDGKPVVQAGADLVNKLVEMALAYRDSQPITVLAATGILSAAERELNFHQEKNPMADFSVVEERITGAREALKAVAFTKDADCRVVVDGLGDVAGTCRQITIDSKVAHVRDLAKNAGMVEATEEQIVEALGKSDFREKVNALGILTKTLYGLGAKTSETVARLAERENRGNGRGGRQVTGQPGTRGFPQAAWQERRGRGRQQGSRF